MNQGVGGGINYVNFLMGLCSTQMYLYIKKTCWICARYQGLALKQALGEILGYRLIVSCPHFSSMKIGYNLPSTLRKTDPGTAKVCLKRYAEEKRMSTYVPCSSCIHHRLGLLISLNYNTLSAITVEINR
jgi:hypothetical protein